MRATYVCLESLFGIGTTGPENRSVDHFKEKWLSVDKTQRFQMLSFESG